MKTYLPSALFSLALALGTSALAQTGFLQTGAGPFDYNDTENWVGGTAGDINGIWDSSLTLTASQTVTFGEDTTLLTGLAIGYAGNFDLTFRSDGTADRTLTLGGDITVSPASNRTVNFGSFTADQGLDIDLGGNRVFTVTSGKSLVFYNTISGGDLTITGDSPTTAGGTVRFGRTLGNAATSNITVAQNATLQFDNSANGYVGATRAQSLTLLSGGKLSVRGNNNTNTVEVITGALTTDGAGARPRFASNNYHSVTLDAGNAHTLLSIGSLERANQGTLLVRGDNLGVNTIASATGGSSNIQIDGPAPALVGGGGADGTTTISIIPWLVGGTTISDNGSTFVTYTEANGLRPLDIATEFASAFGGNATDNVRLTATSDTAIVGDVTVNSLILAGQGGSISGDGTVTVTSGAILMTRTTGSSSNINVNINFGTAEGIIGFARGDTINGAISGSGGLTVHGNRNDENMTFNNGTTTTYTGDTTILSNAMVAAGFLPYADRTGDVYVYGNLQLHTGGFTGTINGLNGNGIVAYGNSSNSTISIGDNNASGNFTGSINGNNNLRVAKIGAGTQIFGGASTYGRGTEVNEGTLLITNTEGSGTGTGGVTVASGARFGGTGTSTGLVTASAADSVIIAGGVNEIGTLSLIGGLTAANGASFAYDISGASIDTIDFGAGSLNLAGTVSFDFTSLGSVQTGVDYTLFTGTGDWSGSVAATFFFEGPVGYEVSSFIFDTENNLLTVQFTGGVIPEPSTAALLVGLGALLAAARRRSH